jgi:prepilin-type N-terminal cleavage/methylation domain-containing protein
MKQGIFSRNRAWAPRGFTLLETILALCIVSFLGAMVFSLTHSPVLSTVSASAHASEQFRLQREMEEINAEYRRLLRVTPTLTAVQFKAALDTLQNADSTPKFLYLNAGKTGYLAAGGLTVAGPGAAFTTSANVAYRITLTSGDQTYSAIFTFPN